MSKYRKTIRSVFAALALVTAGAVNAQIADMGAMPFLTMETDARTAGMAGTGVSLVDNPLAVYRNAATSTLGEGEFGAGVFAGPWNTGFKTADVVYGAGGFWKWNDNNSAVAGFRYLPGPTIETMDDEGFPTGTARSKDMAADIGYSRKIGRNLALSLTARWIMSDQGFGDPKINAFAFDLGAAYTRGLSWFDGARWAAGFRLADMGPKVKMNNGEKYPLPGSAVVGGSVVLPFSEKHVLLCAVDLDWQFQPTGVFGASLGAEYTFLKHGVVRAGYHVGPSSKGPGNYAAVGCGFIAGPVRFDASCRLGGERSNPLNNTFIFTLGFTM